MKPQTPPTLKLLPSPTDGTGQHAMNSDRIKVALASFLGVGTPTGSSLFFEGLEPILQSLVYLGQFAVAIATCLYILRKWKNAKQSPRKPRKRNRE